MIDRTAVGRGSGGREIHRRSRCAVVRALMRWGGQGHLDRASDGLHVDVAELGIRSACALRKC